MKSLLEKDFKLIKNRIGVILLGALILLMVFYLNHHEDFTIGAGFICGYMSLLGMLYAVRTINTDKEDHSDTYLFSLPFERKTYIYEKYLFCFLIGIIFLVISFIIIIFASFLMPLDLTVTFYTALAVFAFVFLIVDVMIPVELKYNKLKSYLIFVGVLLFFMVLLLAFGYFAITYANNIPFLARMTAEELILYLYLFAIICTWISIRISLKIINKKDF